MPSLQQGSVVAYQITPLRGDKEVPRPAVVLTKTDQINKSLPLRLVAISSSPYQNEPHAIPLPWHPQGRVQTGLYKKCAAICNWLETVPPGWTDEQVVCMGLVPEKILTLIKLEIEKIEQQDDSDSGCQ